MYMPSLVTVIGTVVSKRIAVNSEFATAVCSPVNGVELPYTTAHVPVVQLGATAQTLPHRPQLFLSFVVLAQTPWVAQTVRPPPQVKLQVPLQTAVPLAGTGHTLQVLPHFVTSSSAAQAAPQAWKLDLQVKSHELFAQLARPFNGAVHLFAHAPQLLGLVAVTTHWSPHLVSPVEQLETHVGDAPALVAQSGALAGQTVVHEPQCAAVMSTHAPSQTI
jgi:hypothetical protein